jgi:hypothetical protein
MKKIFILEEFIMKTTVKCLFGALCIAAGLGTLASCASSPNSVAAALTPKKKTVQLIDTKSSVAGIPVPQWVQTYLGDGIGAVGRLSEYKGLTPFIVEVEDTNKDFATTWVQGTEAPLQVAQEINLTLQGNVKSAMTGASGEDVQRSLDRINSMSTNISLTGLKFDSFWWMETQNIQTKETKFTAYGLYLIDTKMLNQQIITQLQKFINSKNQALSNAEAKAYDQIVNSLLSGTGVTQLPGASEATSQASGLPPDPTASADSQ